MGTCGGGWAALGCEETKGSRPSRLFLALELDALAVSAVKPLGSRPGRSECGVLFQGCPGATFLLEAGVRQVRQVPSLSLSVPPLYNGDKSAEPTGSLRAFSDNTGVSLWPCGYCGVVSACMNSGHFLFLINFLVTGQTSKGEEKGPGEKFIVTSACYDQDPIVSVSLTQCLARCGAQLHQ